MNFKSVLFSSFLAVMFTGSLLANSPKTFTPELASIIKSELSQYNLDYADLNGQTLKIRFMINERSEIIVLSTNNDDLDETIKQALNYDKIEGKELKPFEIYIVPVTFKSK